MSSTHHVAIEEVVLEAQHGLKVALKIEELSKAAGFIFFSLQLQNHVHPFLMFKLFLVILLSHNPIYTRYIFSFYFNESKSFWMNVRYSCIILLLNFFSKDR